MPLWSAILPAAIGALGSGVGGLLSNKAQNRAAQEQQRAADQRNLMMWGMETAYNHPKAQMKRLESAGLNPNLIYGTPSAASVGQAGSPVKSKAAPVKYDNPLQELGKYSDWAVKAAQADNLREQVTTQKHQQNLLAAQALHESQKTGVTKVTRELAETLRSTNEAIRKEELRQAEAKSGLYETEALIKGETVNDVLETSKKNLKKLGLEIEVKELEKAVHAFRARMAKENLNPNDPAYIRQLLHFKDSIMDWMGEKYDQFQYYNNSPYFNK